MQFDYYKGKKIFITGHTGFKGSWLCQILLNMGADVEGYALEPNSDESLFNILELKSDVKSTYADIRDFGSLKKAYEASKPDIVLHLAAQPIVRDSYRNPKYTYETNVLGTLNILECIRQNPYACSFLNVTTDKVYENNDAINHQFREDEKLDGFDPYSNSKSCSELITHSYKNSFFSDNDSTAISTTRAGNVIGGGDFAKDRIIPDCVRATISGDSIIVRNSHSIRPYQHVLEPLTAYLLIAMKQADDRHYSGYYNIGPDEQDCLDTGTLADLFVKNWGETAKWIGKSDATAPHEASFLKLDCTKIKSVLGWHPIWHAEQAVAETVSWYKAWNEGGHMKSFTDSQIVDYLNYFNLST